MNRKLKIAFVIIMAVVVFVLQNTASFKDQVVEVGFYCKMVAEGSWPDYKNLKETECSKGEENGTR